MEQKVVVLLFAIAISTNGYSQQYLKPEPTYKEVSYDKHERNILDFWQAESDSSTPLVLFIHGGGFQALSKEKLKADHLNKLLEAGISVAAMNYRLVKTDPLPAAFQDAKRALQFLRFKSEEWNIDKSRIGAFGGSAGAMLSMWLAFHDDMADIRNNDKVMRESTRIICVATMGGQITFDRRWMEQSIPGGFIHKNPAFLRIFSIDSFEELDSPEMQELIREISPVTHISANDPPIYMEYEMALDSQIPEDISLRKSWALHHVIFGYTLMGRMRALNIESHLNCPGAESAYQSIPEFFIAKMLDKNNY
ncbi:alpha/beta hydrolase fold domain-containing protein [Bacteroidota bacterium]